MAHTLDLDPYYPGMHRELLDALEQYLNHGLPPGGFLIACLENNLLEACSRAEHWNKPNLPDIVGYLYNLFPAKAWGNRDKVRAWMTQASTKEQPS